MMTVARILLGAALLGLAAGCSNAPEDALETSSSEEGEFEAASDELSTSGPTYRGGTELRTSANLNLRATASTTGSVLTVMPRGTVVTVTAESGANAWVAIRAGKTEGWAHTDYLLEVEPGDEGDAPSTASSGDVDCSGGTETAWENGARSGQVQLMRIGRKVATYKTGHAFLKLRDAMRAAGVTISINSGFRTYAEQQYFYDCYRSGQCNNGNLAAAPGRSNHQNGRALDIAISNNTKFRSELNRLGLSSQWRATVSGEPWHWEYFGNDPGGICE